MLFHRLTWRVGLPFVAVLFACTWFLGWFIPLRLAWQETERFRDAVENAVRFVGTTSLPTTAQTADSLSRVTGNQVFVRVNGLLQPEPHGAHANLGLADQKADREPKDHPGFQSLVVPSESGRGDFVFVRPVDSSVFRPFVVQLLAAFVLLLLLTAWLVVRGLAVPLRNLMEQLPKIETDARLDLPEAHRADEIGDLARAFLRTRAALQDERCARERMEKLAVLGRMTAALAHEVQNPVAAIRMHAQLLHGGADGDTAMTIEHEAGRIENLLNQWLFLTRPEPPALAPLDLGALLAKVVALHAAQARHAAVTVQLQAGHGLVVAADGRRLDQVFRNLLTNALQAMPGGGTLRIVACRADHGVTIDFLDSGKGFSAAALQRCAEFFFSEREGGMGIGLSVASEIVKAHGGALTVQNRIEGGACVRVQLPAAPSELPVVPA
jgi:signal transduction histidine kinase